MKHLFILAMLCLFVNVSRAQTVEILDAKLQVTQQGSQNVGSVYVYLSETTGINSIDVKVGSQPEAADLYTTQLSLTSGGSFWTQGSLQDGVIILPIGSLSNQPDYYTLISLQLSNGTSQTIAVHTSN